MLDVWQPPYCIRLSLISARITPIESSALDKDLERFRLQTCLPDLRQLVSSGSDLKRMASALQIVSVLSKYYFPTNRGYAERLSKFRDRFASILLSGNEVWLPSCCG